MDVCLYLHFEKDSREIRGSTCIFPHVGCTTHLNGLTLRGVESAQIEMTTTATRASSIT